VVEVELTVTYAEQAFVSGHGSTAVVNGEVGGIE